MRVPIATTVGAQNRSVVGRRARVVGATFTVWTLSPLKIPQDRSRGESNEERRQHDMLNRFATLAAVCMLVPVGTAPVALADDPPPPPARPPGHVGPPPDNGVVPSGPPGIAHASDGRTLTVVAKDETQLPVAPLTTSLSSRDWLVGATFTGSGMGSAKGGSFEVGYQIGCAIEMDKIKLNGSIGIGSNAGSLSGTG